MEVGTKVKVKSSARFAGQEAYAKQSAFAGKEGVVVRIYEGQHFNLEVRFSETNASFFNKEELEVVSGS